MAEVCSHDHELLLTLTRLTVWIRRKKQKINFKNADCSPNSKQHRTRDARYIQLHRLYKARLPFFFSLQLADYDSALVGAEDMQVVTMERPVKVHRVGWMMVHWTVRTA